MIIRVNDIEALRDSLKIGDHVKYQTEIMDDRPGHVQKRKNDAVVVAKFPHIAQVRYMARRGNKQEPVFSTITYRELFFQRVGLNY